LQHFLNFFPEPHGHFEFGLIFGIRLPFTVYLAGEGSKISIIIVIMSHMSAKITASKILDWRGHDFTPAIITIQYKGTERVVG
tara:strand:+ start:297 stop:545 length:249 start_codon:yes stop_codon:yes gene_type:complete